MSEPSEKPMIQAPSPELAATGSTSTCERRTTPRLPFTAAADVFDINSQTHVIGRLADLSSGGCYIDTISPFAVDATVRVSLKHQADEFSAKAVVRYALVSMCMGLTFTEIKPEHQAILQRWMSGSSGERAAEPEAVAATLEGGEIDAIVNLRQAVNDLINLMVRKKIMSGAEAAALMRQMFR